MIWERTFLEIRPVCYRAHRLPPAGRAERELHAFLAVEPPVLEDGVPRLGEGL